MKKRFLAGISVMLAAALLLCSCTPAKKNKEDSAEGKEVFSEEVENNAEIKEATAYTKEANAQVYKILDFDDEQEREFAERGFITAPENLEIRTDSGAVAWSQNNYDFVRDGGKAPDTVNPSLWRNAELNALYGLFEVAEGIYQVRGYDLANVTFVRSDHGWIVFDCTTSVETAKAALALLEQEFGQAHIAAVVVSHAHVDHYGGIEGLISQEELADPSLSLEEQAASGKTLIIVPEGYEKAVMEENVFAGNAMKRRSNFQYGSYLETGAAGSLSVGIGLIPSSGTNSYLSPTFEVKEELFEMTLDGVEMVFQLTPGTESPAEMNTYIPA